MGLPEWATVWVADQTAGQRVLDTHALPLGGGGLRGELVAAIAAVDECLPDGGAERLVATLTEHGSPFVAKTLFMTAGAVTSAARTFVDANRSRVLQKPIEPAQLLALASSLTRSEAAAAQ